MSKIVVEPMQEGYLVKGTNDPAEARRHLPLEAVVDNLVMKSAGWYRKVPGQWTEWSLYDAKPASRGAFQGVVFWQENAR